MASPNTFMIVMMFKDPHPNFMLSHHKKKKTLDKRLKNFIKSKPYSRFINDQTIKVFNATMIISK